jgi:hypothetical protein
MSVGQVWDVTCRNDGLGNLVFMKCKIKDVTMDPTVPASYSVLRRFKDVTGHDGFVIRFTFGPAGVTPTYTQTYIGLMIACKNCVTTFIGASALLV